MENIKTFIPTHFFGANIVDMRPKWIRINEENENWLEDKGWLEEVLSIDIVPGFPGIIVVTFIDLLENWHEQAIYKGELTLNTETDV